MVMPRLGRSCIAAAGRAARPTGRRSRRSPTFCATSFDGYAARICSVRSSPRRENSAASARAADRILSPSGRTSPRSCCVSAVSTRRSAGRPSSISGGLRARAGSTRTSRCRNSPRNRPPNEIRSRGPASAVSTDRRKPDVVHRGSVHARCCRGSRWSAGSTGCVRITDRSYWMRSATRSGGIRVDPKRRNLSPTEGLCLPQLPKKNSHASRFSLGDPGPDRTRRRHLLDRAHALSDRGPAVVELFSFEGRRWRIKKDCGFSGLLSAPSRRL